ncbi:hypothetical protein V491_02666, partial [Pseudogymnoascus sp. VKM F-3775]
MLPRHRRDRVKNPMIHPQHIHLVLLAPRKAKDGVQPGNSVGAVLAHHDRLVERVDPAVQLARERRLGLGQVPGLSVPPVVAVKAEHIEQIRDLVRDVGREVNIGK